MWSDFFDTLCALCLCRADLWSSHWSLKHYQLLDKLIVVWFSRKFKRSGLCCMPRYRGMTFTPGNPVFIGCVLMLFYPSIAWYLHTYLIQVSGLKFAVLFWFHKCVSYPAHLLNIIKYGGQWQLWNSSGYLSLIYRGADKSLTRPGRKQATATEDFEFHISYL